MLLDVSEAEKEEYIVKAVFIALITLGAINVASLIKQIVTNCIEKRRKKWLENKKAKWQLACKEKAEKKAAASKLGIVKATN